MSGFLFSLVNAKTDKSCSLRACGVESKSLILHSFRVLSSEKGLANESSKHEKDTGKGACHLKTYCILTGLVWRHDWPSAIWVKKCSRRSNAWSRRVDVSHSVHKGDVVVDGFWNTHHCTPPMNSTFTICIMLLKLWILLPRKLNSSNCGMCMVMYGASCLSASSSNVNSGQSC